MSSPTRDAHPSDEHLIEWLDNEGSLSPDESQHLTSCAMCAEREKRLRDVRAGFWRDLSLVDVPAGAADDLRRNVYAASARHYGAARRVNAFRWAAAAVVVVSALAVASPSLFRLAQETRRHAASGSPRAADPAASSVGDVAETAVSFAVRSPTVRLVFSSRPHRGSLTLRGLPDAAHGTHSLAVLAARGRDARVTVLPEQVLVDNAPAADVVVSLRVPRSVLTVEVYTGDPRRVRLLQWRSSEGDRTITWR